MGSEMCIRDSTYSMHIIYHKNGLQQMWILNNLPQTLLFFQFLFNWPIFHSQHRLWAGSPEGPTILLQKDFDDCCHDSRDLLPAECRPSHPTNKFKAVKALRYGTVEMNKVLISYQSNGSIPPGFITITGGLTVWRPGSTNNHMALSFLPKKSETARHSN